MESWPADWQEEPLLGFLDSLSVGHPLPGLIYFYTRQGTLHEIILIYDTIVGSLMVTYATARTEGLCLQCKVGLIGNSNLNF